MAICSMLVLAKDIGLLFAIFISFTYVLLTIPGYRLIKKNVFAIVAVILSVALPKLLWELNINLNNVHVRFRQPIDFSVLFNVLTGQDQGYLSIVRNRYMIHLLTANLTLGTANIPLTYPILLFIGLGILFRFNRIEDGKDQLEKKQRKTVSVSLFLIMLVYMIGLMILYFFRFDQYEAERLASVDRYLGIAFNALVLSISIIAFVIMQEKTDRIKKWGCVFIIFSLLAVSPTPIMDLVSRKSIMTDSARQWTYQSIVSDMLALSSDQKETKVYIISQANNGSDYWPIHYGIRPCIGLSENSWSISASNKALFEGDIWTNQISAKEWQKTLKEYDYVLIYQNNDTFYKDYASLFKYPNDIGSERIYRIDHTTDLLIRVR